MPDEKNDIVKGEDYNKVVEAHNSLKIEKEKMDKKCVELENELKEVKKIIDEKKSWDNEKEGLQKQIDEIKKQNDTRPVAKGIVSSPIPVDNFKEKLDKVIPEAKINTDKITSGIGRFKHFKSPLSRQFTREDLGKALDLYATAQRVSPDIIPPEARSSMGDLQFRKRGV